jgi:ABC-type glycerol-3-phosphate transport system permease component
MGSVQAMTRLVRGAGIVLAVLIAAAPFYWMILISLTTGPEMVASNNPWIPAPDSSLANYGALLTSPRFARWMLNTLVVTSGTVLIALVASLAAATAVVRMRGQIGRGLLAVLLATYVLPQTVLALPLLVMISGLHLWDTTAALLIAYPGLVIPFGTWAVWRVLSEDWVREILDQARIEGGRGVAFLWQVLLPVTLPALAAVAIFGVAIVFNDYLYLFTLVAGDQATTVMGAVESTNVDLENPGYNFAAMLLGAGPLALVCAWFAERYAGSLAGVVGTPVTQ